MNESVVWVFGPNAHNRGEHMTCIVLKLTYLWPHFNTIHVLTLNMPSCFKDYKRYIHILNHTLDLVWPKYMKLTLKQQYMSVLHNQYHACWCTGDFRSQCISRHDINPQSWNILSSVSEPLPYRNYKDYVYGRCWYRSTWKNKEYLRNKDKAIKGYDVSRHI